MKPIVNLVKRLPINSPCFVMTYELQGGEKVNSSGLGVGRSDIILPFGRLIPSTITIYIPNFHVKTMAMTVYISIAILKPCDIT